jgi:hypothetical protein
MIFFTGLGFLVAPIIVGAFVLGVTLEGWIKSKFGYQMPNGFFMTIQTFVPFALILLLDRFLKAKGPTQKIRDINGNSVVVPASHTFMFFPLKWFAYVWVGLLAALHIVVRFNK